MSVRASRRVLPPAGVEEFLEELAEEIAGDPGNLEIILEIAGRHAIEAVLPG